jgi:dTDP-4-amino-4,6-dideoxygalactose transaminase
MTTRASQHHLSLHLIPDLPSAAALLPNLQRVEAQRWYTNYGPLVLAFEAGLKALLQQANPTVDFALTTLSTGYHALELGLQALDLPQGASVLVPAVTFPACPLAVYHAGLTPVLADIAAENWQLTPAIARQIATQHKIAAVMPVAVYGVPVDAAAWDAFVQDTGIPVLIDAAAAVETQKIPQHCLVAHSLHATKPFGIGEGGALVGAAALITKVRQLSNFGTVDRIAHTWGTNAKLSEFHGVVGLAQLARWPEIKARRAALLAQYQAALAALPVRLQPAIEQAVPSLLMLDCAPVLASAVRAVLQAQGIATHQTYLPALYRHPAFAELQRFSVEGCAVEHCPHADRMVQHVVGVPFHPFMTDDDVMRVVAALQLAGLGS